MIVYKALASFFGIGYAKGSGTIASILTCLIIYAVNSQNVIKVQNHILSLILITGIGIWCAYKLEPVWGKDSPKIVIDEVAGTLVSMAGIPVNPMNLMLALVIFRYFDIYKPLGINRLDKINSAWAVMADDLLAGFYTLILMYTIIYITA